MKRSYEVSFVVVFVLVCVCEVLLLKNGELMMLNRKERRDMLLVYIFAEVGGAENRSNCDNNPSRRRVESFGHDRSHLHAEVAEKSQYKCQVNPPRSHVSIPSSRRVNSSCMERQKTGFCPPDPAVSKSNLPMMRKLVINSANWNIGYVVDVS